MPAVAAFHERKPSGRQRLLSAATDVFCRDGYFAVSVEDIAVAACVSRMTFYRHFAGKAAIAAEIFRENAEASMPRFLAIGAHGRLDHTIVSEWIAGLFEADRRSGQLLRVFIQANAEASGFTQSAQRFIDDLITGLGQSIPAFALDRLANRKAWLEAWLLLYEILDQSNHAARGAGVAADPLVIDILAERFLEFASRDSGRQKSCPVLVCDKDNGGSNQNG
jgi:AcrR family transcriptional regulator